MSDLHTYLLLEANVLSFCYHNSNPTWEYDYAATAAARCEIAALEEILLPN
jgi:hypothetical protein